MAFPVTLYNFSKRENSTKIPDVAGEAFDVELKSSSSIISPSLIFKLPASFNVASYNYASIPIWKRYYFITGWSWEQGVWVCTLAVDVLASFKSEIGASNQYVVRSSFTFDGTIIDNYYATKNITSVNSIVAGDNPWRAYLNSGYYVLGVVNSSKNTVGASSFYVMNTAQFNNFKAYMMDGARWMGENIWDDLSRNAQFTLKAQFNPSQYITSIMWYPFKPPTDGSVSELPLGWWTISGVSADILSGESIYTFSTSMSIPRHPQSNRGSYLNLNPYSRYSLNAQPWGIIPLDSTKLAHINELRATAYIDCSTGVGTLNVDDGAAYHSIAQASCTFGVSMSMAQTHIDFVDLADTVYTTFSGVKRSFTNAVLAPITSGRDLGGAIKTISNEGANITDTLESGVVDAFNSMYPETRVSGANSSLISFLQPWHLTAWFQNVVEEDNSNLGRPLCQNKVISTIPGYIMVSHPDVEIDGAQEEMAAISSFMSGGFFYE